MTIAYAKRLQGWSFIRFNIVLSPGHQRSFFAQQAATQLTEKNIKVILSRYYYRMPMADANRNAQLTYWHDAISEWYGQNVTTADYQDYAGIDAVLELGFGNYRIFEEQPSMQVLMKLIDSRTRQVTLNQDSEPFKQWVL